MWAGYGKGEIVVDALYMHVCVCARAHVNVYECMYLYMYVYVHIHMYASLRSLTKQIILDSYRIAPGQCNWISIDEKSGEVRTIKVLDRDIEEMRQGQCNITVLAIDRSEY